MNIDATSIPKDQREKHIFIEAFNMEKQLWALIHSNGLLLANVRELYRKARGGYENVILSYPNMTELQDVEYSLWKLHYRHIDEFRKGIRQSAANEVSSKLETRDDGEKVKNNTDIYIEGFKSFLSEATVFYRDLITKLRKGHGFGSFLDEPMKLYKCQYSCHRFLVCLGDLARYMELCKKTDIGNRNWSVAASYYLEAAITWPDSGNPQNQLALLATYIGDDFLALYHCVRSLAVKEPFPDAWDNLILLFEKNRSSQLHSLSREVLFDFLKSSERNSSLIKTHLSSSSLDKNKLDAIENVSSGNADLWPLFVRMTSFFFIKSSLEDFTFTFASTMKELEDLLAMDHTKLRTSLESYEQMNSAKRGPYRALQVVSILIFIIHSLTESPEIDDQKEKNDMKQSALTQLAWTASFICMGRLLERCLKDNHQDRCPLLAAVLVFLEWLVDMVDRSETYGADEKVTNAMSYFFGALVDLLNRIDIKESEASPDHMALWEDYELRGFSLIAHSHSSLDFTTDSEQMGNCDSRNESRVRRLFHAAVKIVEKYGDSQKWISYDKLRRKFYTTEDREAIAVESGSDLEVKEPDHNKCVTTECENDVPGKGENQACVKGLSLATEEEEVILFKPIARHNSVPINKIYTGCSRDQTAPSDEFLRRATSLSLAQNRPQIDPSSIDSDSPNFRFSKPFKQQEPLLKESTTYPAGPPSLSAWVLDRELNFEGEKGTRNFTKHELSPIEEVASASLAGLSINETEDFVIGSKSSSPYVAPVPSAPFLPDDAVWFKGNCSSSSDNAMGITEADGILGPSPISGYLNLSAARGPFDFVPGISGFIERHPPLSSSEWLSQYRNNHNLENSPGLIGNFHGYDASRFDLFDRWGNPLVPNRMVYFENPQLFPVYQRASPYGCGVGTDLRTEQPPLLQYLKEREWQLQQEAQVRGHTYMGN